MGCKVSGGGCSLDQDRVRCLCGEGGVKDTSWVSPTVLERRVGGREGCILGRTLFEKPAVARVGQDAGIVG